MTRIQTAICIVVAIINLASLAIVALVVYGARTGQEEGRDD